jgi:DNA-binding transcriptional regulator YbjK
MDTVADAAIVVLAAQGMRGLTHRAVDEAADLPLGSASNLARTRAALLNLALVRLAAVEAEEYMSTYEDHEYADCPGSAAEALVDTVANGLLAALTTKRHLTLARFELALEATRRPELRKLYDRLGRDVRLLVTDLLARAGSTSPSADARTLVSACEGLLLYRVAGAGHASRPGPEELRREVGKLVRPLVRTQGLPAAG